MSDTAQQSPFAAPSGAAPTPATPTASASPFAAPAQTAAPAAPVATTDVGDTSYFDTVASNEPLVKPCTVPGVIVAIEEKTSATSGNPFVNLAVQLYGNEMKYEDGTPCPPGKRLQSSLFLSAKDSDKFKRTARQVKNFALALWNIPLDGKEEAAYKALPPQQKLGVVATPTGTLTATIAALQPLSQWVSTKVMVQVSKGKDMDGNPRNEFSILAASTKPVERKSK